MHKNRVSVRQKMNSVSAEEGQTVSAAMDILKRAFLAD